MSPVVVVLALPVADDDLGVQQRVEPVDVQILIAPATIERLDETATPWFAWLNVEQAGGARAHSAVASLMNTGLLSLCNTAGIASERRRTQPRWIDLRSRRPSGSAPFIVPGVVADLEAYLIRALTREGMEIAKGPKASSAGTSPNSPRRSASISSHPRCWHSIGIESLPSYSTSRAPRSFANSNVPRHRGPSCSAAKTPPSIAAITGRSREAEDRQGLRSR